MWHFLMCKLSLEPVARFPSNLQGCIIGTSFRADKILVTLTPLSRSTQEECQFYMVGCYQFFLWKCIWFPKNMLVIFLLYNNKCYGYSLEGGSSEYSKCPKISNTLFNTFCWPLWLSWMRRPTGDQEVAGSTPAEVGNILSWRLIMKYFLRSFSPFCWFKKGSCQFLAKECAQYWLTA